MTGHFLLRFGRSCLPVALLVATSLAPSVLHADGATPSPSEGNRPDRSTPTCDVSPRPVEEVRRIIGTPRTTDVGAIAVMPTALPTGPDAGAETTAEITATVRRFFACIDTGEDVRFLALVSDRYLASIGPLDAEALGQLGTPQPTPEDSDEGVQSLLGVWRVQEIGDGRVAAAVIVGNVVDSHPAPGRISLYIFVRQGDQWLLDETVDEVEIDGTPVFVADLVGTPPASATPTS